MVTSSPKSQNDKETFNFHLQLILILLNIMNIGIAVLPHKFEITKNQYDLVQNSIGPESNN